MLNNYGCHYLLHKHNNNLDLHVQCLLPPQRLCLVTPFSTFDMEYVVEVSLDSKFRHNKLEYMVDWLVFERAHQEYCWCYNFL